MAKLSKIKTKLIRSRWLIVVVICLVIISFQVQSDKPTPRIANATTSYIQKLKAIFAAKYCKMYAISSYQAIEKMLTQKSVAMSQAVIQKVLRTLKCAKAFETRHNHILTVIDYSLPANQKRLWVFDLQKNKMLFHTYVAHGIASGGLLTNQFSNQYNSKASSLGVYRTDQSYYGRHGLSLRLTGLEPGFNDNASRRAIVMHSAWYVNEQFIKKYGRPGRSWGCPAISKELKSEVINTIKNNGLFIVYYPGENWFLHSKYLNCQKNSQVPRTALMSTQLHPQDEVRKSVVFVEHTKDKHRGENDPVLVISADNYLKTFQKPVPLTRMLRCQIHGAEYVALSDEEFETLAHSQSEMLKEILFVVPNVILTAEGRYKRTEMRIVNLGHIQSVEVQDKLNKDYLVSFDKGSSAHLKTTDKFIRWVGL